MLCHASSSKIECIFLMQLLNSFALKISLYFTANDVAKIVQYYLRKSDTACSSVASLLKIYLWIEVLGPSIPPLATFTY